MNDLLRLTSELVGFIKNTSNVTNVTNIQNSTWKSPIKEQEDKIKQIHHKFLKAEEWGNNLKQKNTIWSAIKSTHQSKINKVRTKRSDQINVTISNSDFEKARKFEINNKIYFKLDANAYEYDPSTKQFKIVIKEMSVGQTVGGQPMSIFIDEGNVFYNRLYFTTNLGEVYEYDPETGIGKLVINVEGNLNYNAQHRIIENKIYFGWREGDLCEYDANNKTYKIIFKNSLSNINTGYSVGFTGLIFKYNNKLYFGSRIGKVYEYDPSTQQQKIVISTEDKSEYFELNYHLILNNKFYFVSTKNKAYEYDPSTQQQKIIIDTKEISNYLRLNIFTFNSRLCFASISQAYEYDPSTQQLNKIIEATNEDLTFPVFLNNKIYFALRHSVKGYEYDPKIKQKSLIFELQVEDWENIWTVFAFNNKVYFIFWYDKVYEYDPSTKQFKIVINSEQEETFAGSNISTADNKLRITTSKGKVYEYDPLALIVNNTNSNVEQHSQENDLDLLMILCFIIFATTLGFGIVYNNKRSRELTIVNQSLQTKNQSNINIELLNLQSKDKINDNLFYNQEKLEQETEEISHLLQDQITSINTLDFTNQSTINNNSINKIVI